MKIGIIGLGTLGEYYTRDFNRFNTKVIVSKNSTLKSTINKNNLLKKKYKLNILAAKNYSDFFNKKIDTVLICSPNDSHLYHLQKSINKKKDVIIEKPIISLKKSLSKKYFIDKLNKILSHDKKIYYNLINEYYAKKYLELFINHKFKNKKFDFIYHTDGTHKKEGIMNDLLPHLFSILDNLLDYNKVSNIKKSITLNKNIIQFYADDCFCNIELIQSSKKKLKFGLDNLIVEREIYGPLAEDLDIPWFLSSDTARVLRVPEVQELVDEKKILMLQDNIGNRIYRIIVPPYLIIVPL